MPYSKPLKDRLWPRLKISESGCWEWTGSLIGKGYGQLPWKGGKLAHRAAYVLAYGEIPEDKFVLHKCDNPPCCNPLHLFLGTQMDNIHDMMRKGRLRTGLYNKVITPEDLKLIRKFNDKKIQQRIIATMFGVSPALICRLLRRGSYD